MDLAGLDAAAALAVARAAAAGHGEIFVNVGECIPAITPGLVERANVRLLGARWSDLLEGGLRDVQQTMLKDVIDLLQKSGHIPAAREASPQEKADTVASLESIGFHAARKRAEDGRMRGYLRASQ